MRWKQPYPDRILFLGDFCIPVLLLCDRLLQVEKMRTRDAPNAVLHCVYTACTACTAWGRINSDISFSQLHNFVILDATHVPNFGACLQAFRGNNSKYLLTSSKRIQQKKAKKTFCTIHHIKVNQPHTVHAVQHRVWSIPLHFYAPDTPER